MGVAGKGAEFRQELPADDIGDDFTVLPFFPLMSMGPGAELTGKIPAEIIYRLTLIVVSDTAGKVEEFPFMRKKKGRVPHS